MGSYHSSFLQTAAWAEVQAAYGRTVQTIQQADLTIRAIRYALPAKQWYWFIPQGPCPEKIDVLNDGALFVRYEPMTAPTQGKHIKDVHPSTTLVTPLSDAEQMLARCKQKTRYNIRLAEKKGVTVHTTEDVELFYQLLRSTAQTQGIRLHAKDYYETIFRVLSSYQMVKLYLAYYQQQPVATAMVIYHEDMATYLHGGSDHAQRAVMAPHLLHWQIMQDAAAAGHHYYDWFGIAPADQPNHPFAGITRFKLGFGGEVVTRPGTYELPLKPMWYTAYKIAKKLWIL